MTEIPSPDPTPSPTEPPEPTMLRQYLVVGPERGWIDVVCDDGTGPWMLEHDVYFIEAPNRRLAKWAAFRLAKKNGDSWYSDLGGEHPLTGVTVEDLTDVPEETGDDWPDELKATVRSDPPPIREEGKR